MKKKTEEEKLERLDFLYCEAVGRYLNKNDFDVYNWLVDEEIEEYEKLLVETGQK